MPGGDDRTIDVIDTALDIFSRSDDSEFALVADLSSSLLLVLLSV